jgi:hypothetical protein
MSQKKECENIFVEEKEEAEKVEAAEYLEISRTTKNDVLYVIAIISNPARYDKRYKLFNEFCERMEKECYVKLVTVELQQGLRPFATSAMIKLRTDHEIWYKENLINIAVRHLPHDWKYMAWIDTDLEFQNKNWARETIEQLQTYKVVQIFSHCIDLGVKDETLQVHTGIFYAYCNGEKYITPSKYGNYFHVGYAYAITKAGYNGIGGLLEFAVLGSADNHMALAMLGIVDESLNKKLHSNYKMMCKIFQDRCEKNIKRNVGYVHGTIMHHFHGNKVDRKYQDRWLILVNNQFDPLVDIYKDHQGLWQLDDGKYKLRDDIIRYFRERNEDCNVMPSDYKYCKGRWI